MKKIQVLWAAGVGLLTITLLAANLWAAADSETNAAVNAIADLLQKNDAAAAKKAAKELAAKAETDAVMDAFYLRSKKGIGVGPKANVFVPDGIELKINAIARDGITADKLKTEGEALQRVGYVMAAVAHFAQAKAPLKDAPKQKKSDWIQWSEDLAKASAEFTTAAKGTSPAELKKAADKVKKSCDSCHAVFK
jgi:hypothetical protein